MTTFTSLLKDHGTVIQILLYLVVIVSFWTVEFIVTFKSIKEKWHHTWINLMFILSALPVQLSLTVIVIFVSGWVTLHHWGILYYIPFHHNLWVKYTVGFFLMDFFEYCYHLLMHKTAPLWNLHAVHHTDMEMDVSTTVREHPGETLIRVCFQIIWVFLAGASISLLLLRQTIQTFANLFAHTSLKLPAKTEKVLGLLIITPGIHHVHHHFELPYTDSNYGDVFSIWDRMFGTYKEMKPSAIRFGLDLYEGHSTTDFLELVKFPFIKANGPAVVKNSSYYPSPMPQTCKNNSVPSNKSLP